MLSPVVLVTCSLLLVSAGVAAAPADSPPLEPVVSVSGGPLLTAAHRELRRQQVSSQPARSPQRRTSWIGRHPVLVGALAGGAVGALLSTSVQGCWEYDFCPVELAVGTGAGAGAGALVGWAFSH